MRFWMIWVVALAYALAIAIAIHHTEADLHPECWHGMTIGNERSC